MTISVAIATYNRASMVREAVLAALAQSRAPEEVVVSDDASTDETIATLERLGDARVKLVRQTRNSGGVGNWNAAMAATSGELIAWCSDDDRYLPGHLQRSSDYLKAHPEVGMVHSGFVDAIETGQGEQYEARSLRPTSILTQGGLIPYLIRYYDWPFHPSTLVMRRSVWEKVGTFSTRYQFADTEWFLRAATLFPVASLARHGVLNRRHPGNWSNRLGSAHLQREVFEMGEQVIGRSLFWRALWRANVRARLALTMRARIRSGHGEAARAAWHGMVQHTGLHTPDWIERAGAAVIARLCAGRDARFLDPRQSVSPL